MRKTKKQTRKLSTKNQLQKPEGGRLAPKTTSHESNVCQCSSRRSSSSSRRSRQQKKRSQKRSDSNTRKKSHSQQSQTSQKRSSRLLPNLHAHCTGSVSKPRPCRDDSWRRRDKITLSAYSTISWAFSKKGQWQTGYWNQCRETSNRSLEMRFVVACSLIALHPHELLC